jgi:hypothetical protein
MAQEARRTTRVTRLQDLQPGTRVLLIGDATAEVVSNPNDGYWLMVRYTEVPDEPSKQGTEELVFVTDILGRLE